MARVEGKRKVNELFLFAIWWFKLFGVEGNVDTKTPQFRAMLGKVKRLKNEGYDLEVIRRTILTMRSQGIDVETPYAIKWQSPIRGKNWYEYSRPITPPVWDGLLTGLVKDNVVPLRVS